MIKIRFHKRQSNNFLNFKDHQDFDLQFDKLFHWTANNQNERQNFLVFLWKVKSFFIKMV